MNYAFSAMLKPCMIKGLGLEKVSEKPVWTLWKSETWNPVGSSEKNVLHYQQLSEDEDDFYLQPWIHPGEIKHSGYFIWSLESLDKVVFDKSSSLMLVFFVRDLCDSEESWGEEEV